MISIPSQKCAQHVVHKHVSTLQTHKLLYVTIGHFIAINVKHELDFYRVLGTTAAATAAALVKFGMSLSVRVCFCEQHILPHVGL